jgi:hypothetical protein
MGINILGNLLMQFASAIPNILAAIAIAVIGMIMAKSVAALVERVLITIKVDVLTDKLSDIDVVQENNINLKLSKIVSMFLYYSLLLIFLIAATDLLKMPALSQLVVDLMNYLPSVITAVVVLIIGLLIANILKNMVAGVCKSMGIPSGKMIANFVFYFVFITALITALAQAKVDTDFVKNNLSIILGGGVAAFALGYGLASRDMMANFLASFYSRRHFNVGDTIKIGDTTGKIIYTDSASVRLQVGENMVVIPVSKFMQEQVEVLKNDLTEIPESL